MFNPDIYRSYDIRGIVPDEFDAGEAYHIGQAYVQLIKPKQVVVARDMRPTGPEFEAELVRGLTEGGADVVLIGMATTPLFYFAIHTLKVDGGLSITASHNPGEYNGIKMTRAEAVPIAAETGLHELRDLVEKREWPEPGDVGKVTEASVTDEYITMLCEGADGVAEGLKVVVDAGNGMTGMLQQRVWDRLGGEVIPLYWEPDGTFPNHEANPIIDENIRDLQAAVIEHGADMGVAFDGDGDRVFFLTEKGEKIDGDIATALLAQEVLKENPGAKIIYDLRASRATPEAIKEQGGEPLITRVGHSYIKEKMRQEGALFAGEVSGHFYFTPWYAELALFAMIFMLRLRQESKLPLSEIAQPLVDRYATSPELNFEVADKEAAMQRVEEALKEEASEVLHLDGLTVRFSDWWCNVRPSGTEPLLRLKVEATDQETLTAKRAQLEELIGGTPVLS